MTPLKDNIINKINTNFVSFFLSASELPTEMKHMSVPLVKVTEHLVEIHEPDFNEPILSVRKRSTSLQDVTTSDSETEEQVYMPRRSSSFMDKESIPSPARSPKLHRRNNGIEDNHHHGHHKKVNKTLSSPGGHSPRALRKNLSPGGHYRRRRSFSDSNIDVSPCVSNCSFTEQLNSLKSKSEIFNNGHTSPSNDYFPKSPFDSPEQQDSPTIRRRTGIDSGNIDLTITRRTIAVAKEVLQNEKECLKTKDHRYD